MARGFWTVLATGCTLAVIGLSMAINFSFGYGLGTGTTNARILGSLSIACDGLKALLPLFVAWQWAGRQRLAAGAGTVLFVFLVAYGAASAIGFAAENRSSLTGSRETANAALADANRDLEAAESKLKALPAHRLAGVIDADLAALRQDRAWDATDGCTDATLATSRAFCKGAATLDAERAVAFEAATLTTKIDDLKRIVTRSRASGAGREADPQAHAITTLTGIDAPHVRSGLTWLLAIAVEAISAFGLFAILGRTPRARPATDTHAKPTSVAVLTSIDPLDPRQKPLRDRSLEPAGGLRLVKAG